MELIIIKDGHVYARARDEDNTASTYSLIIVQDSEMPEYPSFSAGAGKYYDLDYVDGMLSWIAKDRPLTTEERIEQLASDVETIKLAWKAGEAVKVGDRRYYNSIWYTCIMAHTTQSDWTPDLTPAMWEADKA